MKKLIVFQILIFSVLLLPACGTVSEPTDSPQVPPTATNTSLPPTVSNMALPSPTTTEALEPFPEGDCDPNTERIEMDASFIRSVEGGSVLEACAVFCLWIPEGSKLEIGITDFDVDLDVYVDTDLSVLQTEDQCHWMSNEYGIEDEQITIQNPGGRYYIQVCSYEGLASDFILYNEFTP
jgi:hypothetical protein